MSSSPKPTSHPSPTHPVHKLLANIHPPEVAATIFDKTRQKPLLLHPGVPGGNGPSTAATGGNDKRSLRRHIRLKKKQYYLRKQKPQPLSAREKRELGIYRLDKRKGECQYEVYEGLHRLWCGYMVEVLGLGPNQPPDSNQGPQNRNQSVTPGNQKQKQTPNLSHHQSKTITANAHGSLLASADFHGADLEVVRCWCVDRVGIRGIVVRDTKFTFVVVTRKNEMKVVPKRGAVFRYFVPIPVPSTGPGPPTAGSAEGKEQQEGRNEKLLVFEVHGSQIEVRPAERATRKFKWKAMEYL